MSKSFVILSSYILTTITTGSIISTQFQHSFQEIKSPQCGKSLMTEVSGRIAYGKEVPQYKYPWMVSVKKYYNGRIRSTCGGALVSDRHVLTAEHCLPNVYIDKGVGVIFNATMYVGLVQTGSTLRQSCKPPSLECPFFQAEAIRYPHRQHLWAKIKYVYNNYDPTQPENTTIWEIKRDLFLDDIALLRLKVPVTPEYGVSPICLPTASNSELKPGSILSVTGWGETETTGYGPPLREMQTKVVQLEQCSGRLKLPNSVVCLQGGRGLPHVCQGDSGGPLMRYNATSDTYTVVGIVSGHKWIDKATPNCPDQTFPYIYTKVGSHLRWIHKHLDSQ